MTLYEINEEIDRLIRTAEEEEWDADTIKDTLEALQIEKSEKAEHCGLKYKNLMAEAQAYKAEAQAFIQRQKQAERRAKWLEDYLTAMLNGESFKTPFVEVNFRKSKKVIIDDILAIPEEYLRYKEPEACKTDIKKALQDGAHIDGCHLEEGYSTSIK